MSRYWEKQNPNDAFLTHQAPTSNRHGREMINPAADPFAVNQLRGPGGSSRPRVQVRIVSAKGLPSQRGNPSIYATCMAKRTKASMFRTIDSNTDARNPFWDEAAGQMVMRWIPTDVLAFGIFAKDSGNMSCITQSETPVAHCEIHPNAYYPQGMTARLPLLYPDNQPIPGGELEVEIKVHGGTGEGIGSRIAGCCSVSGIRDFLSHAPEAMVKAIFDMLGQPADDRTKGDVWLLILIPCILFWFLTWTGWVLRHMSPPGLVMVECLAALISVGFMVLGVTTHKKAKFPLFAIGALMLVAVWLASICGEYGWNENWRQWWWMHTGHASGAEAATPAESRNDASVLSFDNMKNGTRWTSVDASRAAGYRQGDVYCAAPILDPTVVLGDIMRVNFWAIGINCCDGFGSFTCDDAREISGSVGVVMKGGGMPSFDGHANEFRLAALKAAGVNRLVSAPGALYVRYVSNAQTIMDLYLAKCMYSLFWSLILGILVFGVIGFLTNYYSWGKAGHFPLYNRLAPSKNFAAPSKNAAMQQEMLHAASDTDKKWTLVLASTGGGPRGPTFSLAAAQNQDQVNYATC